METAPHSPPAAEAVLQNLWQHDMVAMRAERDFAALRLRTEAVAVIEGAVYTGNSPA